MIYTNNAECEIIFLRSSLFNRTGRKYFSVQRDDDVINNVRNRVAVYEDSIRRHHEMLEMAACKDSIANKLRKESEIIKKMLPKQH